MIEVRMASRILRAVSAIIFSLSIVACPSVEEPRPPVAQFLESETKLYSESDEELMIRHYFRDRREGFFLDVGAYDWREASTTLYLERELGWKRIAIDANPRFAKDYLENRPGTRFENYFVMDESGGTETLVLGGPLSSSSEDHVRSFPIMKDVDLPRIEVATITLNELLERHEIERIDFLSMDIELGEPAALAGFDIERFRPSLVCIEASKSIRAQILAYFEAHGYERIEEYLPFDRVNWYFRPVGSAS